MINGNTHDLSKAKTYTKKLTVLAFHNPSGATYRKEWGDQEFSDAHWVIVGAVTETPDFKGGRTIEHDNTYGCTVSEFHRMYTWADRAHEYRKVEPITAEQMKEAFTVDVDAGDGVIEAVATGSAGDWLVEQTNGTRMPIMSREFDLLYVEQDS